MQTKVFDMAGKQVGEIALSEAIFGIEPNEAVVHDVVKNHLANCRQGTQSALTRAEVSGGGIKPWRQKGTGRARQGSIRAPQWTHGGIVFAPKPRDYSYTLNKKVKRLALKSVLSAKAQEENIVVIDEIKLDAIKTKPMASFLKAVGADTKALVVTAENNEVVVKSAANIPGVLVTFANLINVYDILNAKTKAAGQQAQTEGYKEIYLSPYEVKAAQENTHQKLENIEELADSFLHVGQEQPTVLARVNGEYRIIDGHRRNAANILNLERGHKEYEKVLYRFMDMSEAMYELRLLAGNGFTQELTAYEKTRLVERTKAALIRAKEEDGLEIQGKMRDLVAAMINESSTNVARMDAINNNATPEIKEQLKEGNLGITAAYEAAKLDEDEQKEIAEKAAAGKNVRAKEIAEKVAEKKAGDDYETPHPESITSLCYSCQKYKDCNVKTGTCQKCDQYINKAEAEKTDEQRYNEEQDAIDRQTKKKLQERADAEKMEHLPSEGNTEHKQHEIKIVASYYEDVVSGKKGFELRKNDRGYKQGDSLKMLEFKDGKHTGRTIDADIIYMLEDYTGLTEGYCILGIRVTDYTGKVSETDTESGAVNV